MDKDIYFAVNPDPQETMDEALRRAQKNMLGLDQSGFLNKIDRAYRTYYGFEEIFSDGHRVRFKGEKGEHIDVSANEYRTLTRIVISLIAGGSPAFDPKSFNTDSKSQIQTKLARLVLDYYLTQKNLDENASRLLEYGVTQTTGFIYIEFDPYIGEIEDVEPAVTKKNEKTGEEEVDTPAQVKREGDFRFHTLSLRDVYSQPSRTARDSQWHVVRLYKNKYDLAAQYPEHAEHILGLKKIQQDYNWGLDDENIIDDKVDFFIFLHEKTAAAQEGRHITAVDGQVLSDGPLIDEVVPIVRFSPSEVLGTDKGYSDTLDLLPLQTMYDEVLSVIMRNFNGFGTHNLVLPPNANWNPTTFMEGLNIIEADLHAGEPKLLNMLAIPNEYFKLLETIPAIMGKTLAINDVTRGQPQPSLKAAQSLALLQSLSVQYAEPAQIAYRKALEKVAMLLISMFRSRAPFKRLTNIVGIANKAYVQEFEDDLLSGISGVGVDLGNPIENTSHGRRGTAQDMLAGGLIENAAQYLQVAATGNLDVITDGSVNELIMVKAEMEKLMAKETVRVIGLENHPLKIKSAMELLSDPEIKADDSRTNHILKYIEEHVGEWGAMTLSELKIAGIPPMFPEELVGSVAEGAAGEQEANVGPTPTEQPPGSGPIDQPDLPNPPAPFDNNKVLPGGN